MCQRRILQDLAHLQFVSLKGPPPPSNKPIQRKKLSTTGFFWGVANVYPMWHMHKFMLTHILSTSAAYSQLARYFFVAQPAASSPICTHIVRLRQIFAYYVYMQMMVEGKRRKGGSGGHGKDDGTRGVYVLH